MAQYAERGQALAQCFGEREAPLQGGLALQHQIDMRRLFVRQGAEVTQFDQALKPERKADRRRRPGAVLFDEAVIAPARTDRALRPEPIRDPFKYGLAVIIKAAHQARIDPVFNPGAVQDLPQPGKMPRRFGAEIIRQRRGRVDQGPERGILAVQDAQRVVQKPALAIRIKFCPMGREIGHQRPAIIPARVGRAQGIELQPQRAGP